MNKEGKVLLREQNNDFDILQVFQCEDNFVEFCFYKKELDNIYLMNSKFADSYFERHELIK